MIYQLCKFICDDITNHEASLRQEPGWGGVEVAALYFGIARGNITRFEFVFGEEPKSSLPPCLQRDRHFYFYENSEQRFA